MYFRVSNLFNTYVFEHHNIISIIGWLRHRIFLPIMGGDNCQKRAQFVGISENGVREVNGEGIISTRIKRVPKF